MTTRVQLAIWLVIFQLSTGCGTGSSPMPSAPSSVPSAPVVPSIPVQASTAAVFVPNITLSGVAYELVQGERVPIEGVDVYCEPCGESTHNWATTDSKGFYTFTGIWGTSFPIRAGKKGYEDPPGARSASNGAGWRDVVINGDTQFDVQLVKK